MLYQELYDKVIEVLGKYETAVASEDGDPIYGITNDKFYKIAVDLATFMCLED
jgi:hypothetical protein